MSIFDPLPEPKIYTRKCPKCPKVIYSLNETEISHNMRLHLEKHERRDNKK